MSLFVPLPSDHLATPLVRAVLPQPGGGGEACPPLSFPSWVTSSTGMGEGILEAERLALLGSVRVFYEDRHFSVGSGCGVLGFFGAPLWGRAQLLALVPSWPCSALTPRRLLSFRPCPRTYPARAHAPHPGRLPSLRLVAFLGAHRPRVCLGCRTATCSLASS